MKFCVCSDWCSSYVREPESHARSSHVRHRLLFNSDPRGGVIVCPSLFVGIDRDRSSSCCHSLPILPLAFLLGLTVAVSVASCCIGSGAMSGAEVCTRWHGGSSIVQKQTKTLGRARAFTPPPRRYHRCIDIHIYIYIYIYI